MRAGFGSNDDSGVQTYSASESETRQGAEDGIAGTKSLDAAAHGGHASGAASQVSLGRLNRGPRIPELQDGLSPRLDVDHGSG
jgi:hypothetical protein